jgi:hypothetical protein
LIHTIGRNRAKLMHRWIDRRIFPGAHPPSLKEMMDIFEGCNFSVLDVENIRQHYAKTLEWWHILYERAADSVVKMFDERSCACGACTCSARRLRSTSASCSCSRWCSRRAATTRSRGHGPTSINPTSIKDERAMTPRESCDVLIVGGGPAGSACARQLGRAGFDVLILDKSQFPRDKVCAGWITPQVVEELEIDTRDYQQGRVLQPITSFITGMGERTARPVHFEKIVSYGIRRCEFDNYLLQRSGARLRLGEAWESMERVDGRWLVNGTISAALVIGAGGHFCPVVRFLGANLGKDERAICAQEIEFEMSDEQALRCGVEHDRPELYFCDDLKGYGWCFRKGNFLNVGLGREGNKGLVEHVHAFSPMAAVAGQGAGRCAGAVQGSRVSALFARQAAGDRRRRAHHR